MAIWRVLIDYDLQLPSFGNLAARISPDRVNLLIFKEWIELV
jgi:hypothetical protein